MAGLAETSTWPAEIYQIEFEDPVEGGAEGISNRQAKELLARTNWLRALIQAVATAEGIPLVNNQATQLLTILDARFTQNAEVNSMINAAVAALVDSSPGALDTLNELAAALGDDPNFAATITAALALKAPLASPALSGVPTAPTAARGANTSQLATTEFVTRAIYERDYKQSCRVASIANINTGAPGANIDGIAMVAGDRLLLKDQTVQTQNGLWIWNGAVVALSRAPDADDGFKLNSMAIVPIEQGTVNADTNWQLTTDGAVTIGTTGLTFTPYSSTGAASETTAGKAEIATQTETDTGTDDTRIVTPLKLKNGFAISLAANGYIKLPSWLGGFILQWISSDVSIGTEGDQLINLPLTFPNAGFGALVMMRISTANTNQNAFANFRALSTTQLSFFHQVAPSSPSTASEGYRGLVWGN